jgi:hypothetical protein
VDRLDIFKIGETGSLTPVHELANRLVGPDLRIRVSDRDGQSEEFSHGLERLRINQISNQTVEGDGARLVKDKKTYKINVSLSVDNFIYTGCVMKTLPDQSKRPLIRAWMKFSVILVIVSAIATPAYADGLSVFIDPLKQGLNLIVVFGFIAGCVMVIGGFLNARGMRTGK